MFRPPDERREVAFGEVVACEAGTDCARAVVQDYGGVVEVVGHNIVEPGAHGALGRTECGENWRLDVA